MNPLRRSRCAYLSALVSEELPCVVNNLLVCQVGVRLLLTDAQHLPQSDSERPHVAGCGELPLQNTTESAHAYKNRKIPRQFELLGQQIEVLKYLFAWYSCLSVWQCVK